MNRKKTKADSKSAAREESTAVAAQEPKPKGNAPEPLKVIIRAVSRKKPRFEGMLSQEESAAIRDREDQLNAEYIQNVLDENSDRDRGIEVNFHKTRKEQELTQVIARTERIDAPCDHGLTLAQVAERRAKGLANVSARKNQRSYLSIFLKNIFTFFNLVALIVAVALLVMRDWANLSFMVIVLLNLFLGIFQECRSKHKIDKLSIVSAPVAQVIRGGEKYTVAIEDIVLDDIIVLENGKQICTDSVVKSGKVQVNESLLTGESKLVLKQPGDTLYAGSFVASGSCCARAEKIGSANYIESLTAFAKKYKKRSSELLRAVQRIIKIIAIFLIPIAALMLYNNYRYFSANTAPDSAMSAWQSTIAYTAGSIIGMIPAGMFLLTSIALAAGMIKLAKNHVLVQDLYCIEMLARTDVLCLDKTGTITDGTMNVSEVIPINKLRTDVRLEDAMSSFFVATGDNNQTSIAVMNHFGRTASLKAVAVLPFSSQRKLSAVTFEGDGTFVLGAPEFVLPKMDAALRQLVEQKARHGLRVLMVAQSPGEIKGETLPTDLICSALICIEDHIRDDAVETIAWFKKNDVEVKVISGDNPITVSEVASRAGIENADQYISLEGMSDQEVVEIAGRYTVFGRVTPEQKRILIRAIKLKGHTVAMTGDGVNDILALKEADCSIAMAAGSEAARSVSHMVLTDSNFGNMPTVVLEGRRIINNIQKSASLYTMKTMFSFILSVIVLIMGIVNVMKYPVTPKNMILLEMFVIGGSSLLLAFQPNTQRIKGHFLPNLLKESVPNGITLVCGYMALYGYAQSMGLDDTTTKSMTVLIITFTGFTLLLKLCQPLNLYRTILIFVCGGLVGIASMLSMLTMTKDPESFFPKMFEIGPLELTSILFVIVIVMLSYVLSSALAMITNAALASQAKRAAEEKKKNA